jgi:cytochrome c-type biogenesis protein CcmH
MTPEDRQAMIGGMVAGLADRLANDGGTAADWARLITAYGVLGETDNARAIWVEAADVFGANAEAMAILTQAARDAGVVE